MLEQLRRKSNVSLWALEMLGGWQKSKIREGKTSRRAQEVILERSEEDLNGDDSNGSTRKRFKFTLLRLT